MIPQKQKPHQIVVVRGFFFGGAYGGRTRDLLTASQARIPTAPMPHIVENNTILTELQQPFLIFAVPDQLQNLLIPELLLPAKVHFFHHRKLH